MTSLDRQMPTLVNDTKQLSVKEKHASHSEQPVRIVLKMERENLKVLWIDSTIIAERPKLNPFIEKMKEAI